MREIRLYFRGQLRDQFPSGTLRRATAETALPSDRPAGNSRMRWPFLGSTGELHRPDQDGGVGFADGHEILSERFVLERWFSRRYTSLDWPLRAVRDGKTGSHVRPLPVGAFARVQE